MNKLAITHEFHHPQTAPPAWAQDFERWNQLDAASFGFVDFYALKLNREKRPEMILLASPDASNKTDYAFSQHPTPSPARFVHTLPNIRAAALLQFMGYSCPILCIQNGLDTQQTAEAQCEVLLKAGMNTIWVLRLENGSKNLFKVVLNIYTNHA